MSRNRQVSRFLKVLEEVAATLPDKRAGRHNQIYELADAVNGAFAVFFTQSASFLAYQRDILRQKRRSNAQSVFQMREIPSDNHIRALLDEVPAASFNTCYEWLWAELEAEGRLADYRLMNGRLLVGVDGIVYFSSHKLHCDQCNQEVIGERVHYSHRALTALVVHPQQSEVLPRAPEFITPQDGAEKQDCELSAAKRWLKREEGWLQANQAIILGDDLFSHQPFCRQVTDAGLGFILVCKPTSHELLYEWLAGMEQGGKLAHLERRQWNGRHGELWCYRWACDIPLRAGDDALRVNWCDVTVSHQTEGTQLYHNSFVTNLVVDQASVQAVVAAGRSRWKHENEGHNVLTTRGYHIKHNFGHGDRYLAQVMFTLNLLAFFLHTCLLLTDSRYQQVRQELGTRQTFFDDIRALMRYQFFDSWETLLRFMAVGLELEAPP